MPTRIRDLVDTNLEVLDTDGTGKSNHVLRYNATTEKFDVVSTDDILLKSIETPSPRDFIATLESELEDVTRTFEGGTF